MSKLFIFFFKVKGPGLQKAFRNQKAQFVVDTREAGNYYPI